MELVKIATGEPTTRNQLEAEWIAAQPATVTVPDTIEGENGPETVMVEIDNHVDFRLPFTLTNDLLAPFGVTIVEPATPRLLIPAKWRSAMAR